MIEWSMLGALAELAQQRPDADAYTFVDYGVGSSEYRETLTWSEVYHRAQIVAQQLVSQGSPGDRVAITAPQGLEYIIGFLGTIMAGRIAVPLSVPLLSADEERIRAAVQDSSPVAILTTSTAVNRVVACTRVLHGHLPEIIEIDSLDLTTPVDFIHVPRIDMALIQYTSGSTRMPAGVMVSHKTLDRGASMLAADYLEEIGGVPPADGTFVSWLPFYHDMGLLTGIMCGIIGRCPTIIMSPMSFLKKPARWMQLLASSPKSYSAAPNFAFDLVLRRTTDSDMDGFDLGGVHTITTGGERVQATTVRRFIERFARFNLSANAVAPSYGLAEAMYGVSASRAHRPTIVRFDYAGLIAGVAKPVTEESGVELVGVGVPRTSTVRIVDPETRKECSAGTIGEVWLHGANVSSGYWRKPELSEYTFGGRIVDPTPGTPSAAWLRTGDLGTLVDGELFIVGRIKDMLIVDGRNHYPDDIEATMREVTGERTVAISVPTADGEQLVAVLEFKKRGGSQQEISDRMHAIKHDVTSAIAKVHGLRVADIVMVPPASIPVTSSGKIRRSACAEAYRRNGFIRLRDPLASDVNIMPDSDTVTAPLPRKAEALS